MKSITAATCQADSSILVESTSSTVGDQAALARAIAALPELIAALRDMTTWLEADTLGYCAPELRHVSAARHTAQARSALQKAGF